jgi:hypothetical protein
MEYWLPNKGDALHDENKVIQKESPFHGNQDS